MPLVELTDYQLDTLRSIVREEYQFWSDEDGESDRTAVLDELSEILEKAALE